MSLDWVGQKPGTFVNESTNVPLDADNMNAIARTVEKIAEGGEGTGLDADLLQGKALNSLRFSSDEELSIYFSFDKKIYNTDDKEHSKFLNDNISSLQVVGSEPIASTTGVLNRSVLFNGNSYFSGTYENSSAITISFWYKGIATTEENIVSLFRTTSDYRIRVATNLGKAVFCWMNASNTAITLTSTTSINDNQFHHICCTHNGTVGCLYVDGILQQQQTNTLNSSTNTVLRIGAGINETPVIMNGQVDEFKIYKRALTSNEAYSLFFNKISSKEYNIEQKVVGNSIVERDENGSIKSKSTFIENIEIKRKVDNIDSSIIVGSTKSEISLDINTDVQIDDNSIITSGANITLPSTGVLSTTEGEETLTNKTLTLPKINSEIETSATSEELNHLEGISSNVQDQLDDKAPLDSPEFTGIPTGPDLIINQNDEQLANSKSVLAQINHSINPLNVFKEWSETYSYSLNEPTFYNGVPYKSLQNTNTNHTPDVSPDYWEITGGGGGEATGINEGYNLENGSFEKDIEGWQSFYNDPLGVISGEGGSPTEITIERNTVSPLFGEADLKVSLATNALEGNGFSYTFIPERGVSGAVEVKLTSATSGSTLNTNIMDYFDIYLRLDITSGVSLLSPAYTFNSSNNDYGYPVQHIFGFNSTYEADVTNYRLIFISKTVPLSDVNFQIDNVSIIKKDPERNIFTLDEKDAITNSSSPSSSNPFITQSAMNAYVPPVRLSLTAPTTPQDGDMWLE